VAGQRRLIDFQIVIVVCLFPSLNHQNVCDVESAKYSDIFYDVDKTFKIVKI
jgi:hypothetical protein